MVFSQEKKESTQRYAKLFDNVLDYALAYKKYMLLEEDSSIFLPFGDDYEMVTEIIGITNSGRFIHKLIEERAEFIRKYPDLIEVKIWEDYADDILFNLSSDDYSEYFEAMDWLDKTIQNHDYRCANKIAKDIRVIFRMYEIIPWDDGEIFF